MAQSVTETQIEDQVKILDWCERFARQDIEVGDIVRSFDHYGEVDAEMASDLTGENACYVIGIVEPPDEVSQSFEDCERYTIRIVSRIVNGRTRPLGESHVYPPVNGTPTLMGRIQSGVRLVARDPFLAGAMAEAARLRIRTERIRNERRFAHGS